MRKTHFSSISSLRCKEQQFHPRLYKTTLGKELCINLLCCWIFRCVCVTQQRNVCAPACAEATGVACTRGERASFCELAIAEIQIKKSQLERASQRT
jgi:hypothetical protein